MHTGMHTAYCILSYGHGYALPLLVEYAYIHTRIILDSQSRGFRMQYAVFIYEYAFIQDAACSMIQVLVLVCTGSMVYGVLCTLSAYVVL